MVVNRLYNWLTLADYEEAKSDAAERVVKRLSRGNVAVQNGWYLGDADLASLSEAGDAALSRMRARIPAAVR